MGRLAKRWMALAVAPVTMGLAQAARAQEVVGDWHGVLALPTAQLRIVVRMKPAPAGGLTGELLSPDQSDRAVPISDIAFAGQTFSYAVPSIRAQFSATWDPAKSAWSGQFEQLGAKTPLVLEKGDLPKGPVYADLNGDWEGAIATEAAKIRIVLHVRTGAYGTIATLDSPDQLAYGLPVNGLALDGRGVRFRQSAGPSEYDGVLSPDGATISGKLVNALGARPLDLTKRTGQVAARKRPQTPRPPFPYRAEEVAFDSTPGVRLAGTLTLPQGHGPFGAAVLVTGSGAQDRDETLLGHKPFAVIADDLTRRGVAVLRYDDRGFAKSTGDFTKATTADFAVDAAAAVAYLRTRPEIDPRRIGVIGHSEGGVVAPMVAVKDRRLGFIVLLAGPGAPLGELLAAQRKAIAPTMGVGAAQAVASQALFDHALAAMKGAKDPAEAEARARAILVSEGAPLGLTSAAAGLQAQQLASVWFRSLMDYDPGPVLRRVRAPVLAVNGSKDLQVIASQNLPAIREALAANKDATVIELPGLNHLFQTAGTGAPGEYADIEETVAPSALKVVGEWVAAHAGR